MNLNRLKSNLVNRDWSSKNTKTNISYIKGKLRQFGLTTPKYLNSGKLTNKQIQTQTKRIINAINREKDILRKEASKTTLATLVNDILNSLGYKMLKIEFNNEEIAKIDYTKDGTVIKDMFIAYRFMKLANLRNKVLSEVM